MPWKNMEVGFWMKLEQKPCRKETFDRKWTMTVTLAKVSSNKLSSAFYSLAICALVLEILIVL